MCWWRWRAPFFALEAMQRRATSYLSNVQHASCLISTKEGPIKPGACKQRHAPIPAKPPPRRPVPRTARALKEAATSLRHRVKAERAIRPKHPAYGFKLSQPASQPTTTKEMWKLFPSRNKKATAARAPLKGATGGCTRVIHGSLAKMSSIGCCVLFTAKLAATPQC